VRACAARGVVEILAGNGYATSEIAELFERKIVAAPAAAQRLE
jgi:hypothetical protein